MIFFHLLKKIKHLLYPHGFLCVLQLKRVPLGDGDNHAVAVDVGDGPCKVKVADASRLFQVTLGRRGLEEYHWLAVLEVVVNLHIGRSGHLDAILIDGVVVGATHAQRIPGITARHLARQAHGLGVQTIGLLLLLVLQAEQFPLPLQLRYG